MNDALKMEDLFVLLAMCSYTLPTGSKLRNTAHALMKTDTIYMMAVERAFNLRDELQQDQGSYLDEVAVEFTLLDGLYRCALKQEVEDAPYAIERRFVLTMLDSDGDVSFDWEEEYPRVHKEKA